MTRAEIFALARRGEALARTLDARADEGTNPVPLERAAVRELSAQLQLLAGIAREYHAALCAGEVPA